MRCENCQDPGIALLTGQRLCIPCTREIEKSGDPPKGWFYSPGGDKFHDLFLTRTIWLKAMGSVDIQQRLRPPQWWIVEQHDQKGRTAASAYAIWHKNYPLARQLGIWAVAPLDDFIAEKYLVEGTRP